jgi:hypothetical protein
MITNYSLLFYLKKPKKFESGAMPIYMRITVNGKSAELTISRKSTPDRWCSKSHRENGTKDNTKGLNSYLDMLQRRLVESHLKLINDQQKITAISLKNKFRDRKDKPHSLIELFKAHKKWNP